MADVAERDVAWLRSDESAKWWGNNGPRLDGALGALASQFGGTPAGEFSKTQFGELRDHPHSLTKADGKTPKLSRATITERLRIVRNAFDWAATVDVIEGGNVPGITTALRALSRLKKGRGKTQRKPVARWVVDATLPYLSSPVVALVELMWWTPARNCRARLFGAR